MISDDPVATLVLVMGLLLIAALVLRNGLRAVGLPALVGFLALGLLVRVLDSYAVTILTPTSRDVFQLLADLGVICLLFRIGLESDIPGLLRHLRSASVVWVGDVFVNAGLGFVAGLYLLDLTWMQSLFLGIGLSATSVGVSVAAWKDAGALRTDEGETLLDVAELDDISGVILMAVLLAIAPVLQGGGGGTETLLATGLRSGALILLKLVVLIGLCLAFSRYLEPPMTRFARSLRPRPDPMLFLVAFVLVLAAVSGMLGFSVALGAFLGGLAFSRDPKASDVEGSFASLYELFVPFFFIHLGLQITPSALADGVWAGAALLGVAAVGKVLGGGGPSLLYHPPRGAWRIGLSLVPRAEIMMIILSRGHVMGSEAVPDRIFSAGVFVVAVTCAVVPILLQRELRGVGNGGNGEDGKNENGETGAARSASGGSSDGAAPSDRAEAEGDAS